MEELRRYKYNGARSLVLLHDRHMRSCIQAWHEAKKLNIKLPVTEDEDYKSLETLLKHFLRSSRNYITWMCEKLGLPDPQIKNPPEVESIENEADGYMEYLLEKWRTPLADIEEEKFFSPVFTSRWGVDYCIEAMLEHAVMHPIRHEFQLKNLIAAQKK